MTPRKDWDYQINGSTEGRAVPVAQPTRHQEIGGMEPLNALANSKLESSPARCSDGLLSLEQGARTDYQPAAAQQQLFNQCRCRTNRSNVTRSPQQLKRTSFYWVVTYPSYC